MEILRLYHTDYEILTENICHIVLQNIMLHLILHKPLDNGEFTEKELKRAGEILRSKSNQEIQGYIAQELRKLIEEYYEDSSLLWDYLCCDISNLAPKQWMFQGIFTESTLQ